MTNFYPYDSDDLDANDLFEEEQRLDDEIESALDQLETELKGLRQIARDLIQYDDQFHTQQSPLSEIVAKARKALVKHGA